MQFYRPLKPIKALTFDLDDTLYDNRPVIRRAEQAMYDWLHSKHPVSRMLTVADWMALKLRLANIDPWLRHDVTLWRFELLKIGLMQLGYSLNQATQAANDGVATVLAVRGDTAMTDYGFGTGNDGFNRLARRYVGELPDTRVLTRRRMNSVEDFVDRLENGDDIEAPIGNLYIISHANQEGWLQISLDDVRRRFRGTNYEVAEEAEQNASVDLDEFLFEPEDGGPTRLRFLRIVGCNVGKAEVFVDKLSDAFGSHVRVRAPKHLNVISRRRRGMYESFQYSFELSRPDHIRSRDAIVQAFQDEGFKFYEGTDADPNLFEAWIPRRLNRRFLRNGGRARSRHEHGRPTLNRAIDGESALRTGIDIKHSQRTYSFRINYDGISPPRDRADQMDALREAFERSDEFDDGHAYPHHERYGHDSLDDFIDGWSWRFRRRRRRLDCTGTRHNYRVAVPLVHIHTGHLIYNFVPLRRSDTEALIEIPEDNAGLIYTST